MREVLDRLREAETALDALLARELGGWQRKDASKTLLRLWDAKYHLWRAQMAVLHSAAEQDAAPSP